MTIQGEIDGLIGEGGGRSVALVLPDEAATSALGARLAPCLSAGDTVLLDGPLGAGKSALARAVIRARLGRPGLEVPSPSYTLVNVYGAGADEIWHADLYRLGATEEAAELGLEEAVERAICLVEWPDRLGESLPARHLRLSLAMAGEGRRLAATALGPRWEQAMAAVRP